MKTRRRIQVTILAGAATVLLALLIGKYIIIPLEGIMDIPSRAFMSGLGALAVIWYLVTLGAGTQYSITRAAAIDDAIPKSAKDLEEMGIKTEIDFAFAMAQLTVYVPSPIFLNALLPPRTYFSPFQFKRSIKLFKSIYGREPFGAWSLDWRYITASETAAKLGIDRGNIPYMAIRREVSKDLIKYIEGEQYLNSDKTA